MPKALREPETRQALLIGVVLWAMTFPLFLSPSLGASHAPPGWAYLSVLFGAMTGMLSVPLVVGAVGMTERLPRQIWRPVVIVLLVTIIALAHSMLSAFVSDAMIVWFEPHTKNTTFSDKTGGLMLRLFLYFTLQSFGTLIWVHGGVAALAAVSRFNAIVRRQQVQVAEARAAAHQAQLAAIRTQLSPHFMFNTLNAISGLVLMGRTADAERMLTGLADLLRASLGSSESGWTPLPTELSLMVAYLDIESVRYDGRLVFEVSCDDGFNEVVVPSFLLQSVVEEAVVQAAASSSGRVFLQIEVGMAWANTFQIVVHVELQDARTSAVLRQTELKTVRDRLAAVYGTSADLTSEAGPTSYEIIMRLPYQEGPPITDGAQPSAA